MIPAEAKGSQDFDVVVVGGALSGAATATLLLRENPGLRLLIIEKSTRFARRVGEATVEVSAFFIGIRLTNCTLKLKKDTRLQIVDPIPAKFGLVRRPAAALKAPLSGACARFSASI